MLGERIPAGPTHERSLWIGLGHGLCHLQKHFGASLHLCLALWRDTAHVHERIASILRYAKALIAFGAFDEIDGREQCGCKCADHIRFSVWVFLVAYLFARELVKHLLGAVCGDRLRAAATTRLWRTI